MIKRIIATNLDRVSSKLELLKDNIGIDYTLEQAIEDINKAIKELEEVAKKYDYSKLPYGL